MKTALKVLAFITSFSVFVYCVWVHAGLWMLAADCITACIWMPLLAHFVGRYWDWKGVEDEENITIY